MASKKDDDQEMSMEEILASIRKYVTEEDPVAYDNEDRMQEESYKQKNSAPFHVSPNGQTPSHTQDDKSFGNEHHDAIVDLRDFEAPQQITQPHPRMTVSQAQSSQRTERAVNGAAPPSHKQSAPTQRHVTSSPTSPQTYAQSAHAPSTMENRFMQQTPQNATQATSHPQAHQAAMAQEQARAQGQQQSGRSAPAQSPQGEGQSSQFASSRTVSNASQSLSKLAETTRALQQQTSSSSDQGLAGNQTLEALAIKSMTPYIKLWLDAYLPELVERLVQKEIETLTRELLQK